MSFLDEPGYSSKARWKRHRVFVTLAERRRIELGEPIFITVDRSSRVAVGDRLTLFQTDQSMRLPNGYRVFSVIETVESSARYSIGIHREVYNQKRKWSFTFLISFCLLALALACGARMLTARTGE